MEVKVLKLERPTVRQTKSDDTTRAICDVEIRSGDFAFEIHHIRVASRGRMLIAQVPKMKTASGLRKIVWLSEGDWRTLSNAVLEHYRRIFGPGDALADNRIIGPL